MQSRFVESPPYRITAVFDQFYVRGRLIVENNAAETARNIIANERLFRLGIAVDLVEMAAAGYTSIRDSQECKSEPCLARALLET